MFARVAFDLPVPTEFTYEVPPELDWFANINNEKTRRAYHGSVQDTCKF